MRSKDVSLDIGNHWSILFLSLIKDILDRKIFSALVISGVKSIEFHLKKQIWPWNDLEDHEQDQI